MENQEGMQWDHRIVDLQPACTIPRLLEIRNNVSSDLQVLLLLCSARAGIQMGGRLRDMTCLCRYARNVTLMEVGAPAPCRCSVVRMMVGATLLVAANALRTNAQH